jgi:cobalamin biosynthesis protein CbiG
MEAEYYYLVVRGLDGSLVTYTQLPEEELKAVRQATTEDTYQTSRQIVDEIERSDLAMRVSNIVLAQLQPKAEQVPDKIKDALKERGIDPESIAPTA